jgi:Flp pilus assembly pilin Flp
MPMVLIEAFVSFGITKRVLTARHRRADISIGSPVTLSQFTRRVRRDDRGQDLIEYAVIAAFVCLVALVGATTLGHTIASLYHSTTHNVDHGATFTSSGSASTSSGGGCKDSKDSTTATAATDAPAGTSTSATTSTAHCK